jgi:FAD/FMN-containing dehydrogenase
VGEVGIGRDRFERRPMSESNRREFLRDGVATTAALGAALGSGASSHEKARDALPASRRVSPASLTELRSELGRRSGRLLLPGDNGYDAASAPANGRFNSIRPFAVAHCESEADVVACVKWSVKHGVPPVVRGGGHSYAGFSTTPDLLINIERLNRVTIDKGKGIATVGGAATSRALFERSVDGPFILPGGTCLGVGVGGLVLGGGIGYNTRWAGLTCDRLRSSRIVIASGEVVEVDATRHKELFWACRGGAGGNFGINTSFAFDLAKVPEGDATYFRFDWRGADAAKAVLSVFHTLLTNPTRKLSAVAMAQAAPVGPKGPREAIEVMSRGQYLGPIDELRALVQPMLDVAKPRKECLELMKFWDIQRIWIGWTEKDQPRRETHSFGDISRYANAPLPVQVTGDLVDLLADAPARSDEAHCSLWSLGWVGGEVVKRFAPTETAYVHRDALTLLRPTTVWPNHVPVSFINRLVEWSDEMLRILEPHTPNESYQNFPNLRLADPLGAYYGVNLRQLREVKKMYDPTNHFRNPQSIPPA